MIWELPAGKKDGTLPAVDQKRLTAVMRGLGTGELKHPRFTKEEAAASGEVVHERLWNYILSLESPEVYFGGGESIHGVSREHDPQGSGWLGCLRRMATRYGCDPKETIGTGHRFFDRGAGSFVYATSGRSITVRWSHLTQETCMMPLASNDGGCYNTRHETDRHRQLRL